MLAVELVALLIVTLYAIVRACTAAEPLRFFVGIACVSAASWVAEESCIRLYHFYSYNPQWSLFIGHVPVLVLIIWPMVIHSASDMAAQIGGSKGGNIFIGTGAIVFTDAALIEPISTTAGLWSWFEPGLFQVPPIVPFGWAVFGGLCAFTSQKIRRRELPLPAYFLILFFPVMGTHLTLLTLWWSTFRWMNITIDPMCGVILAWAVTVYGVVKILQSKPGRRLEKKALLLRLPGAVFFFALLALKGDGEPWLPVYALAFVPPYLTLMSQQYSSRPWGGRT